MLKGALGLRILGGEPAANKAGAKFSELLDAYRPLLPTGSNARALSAAERSQLASSGGKRDEGKLMASIVSAHKVASAISKRKKDKDKTKKGQDERAAGELLDHHSFLPVR